MGTTLCVISKSVILIIQYNIRLIKVDRTQLNNRTCFNSYSDEASIASLKVRLCNLDVNVTKNTFCVNDIENALKCLKNGKAAGYDGIVKEHLLYAHPSIIVHIMFLFNICLLYTSPSPRD